MRVRVRLLGRMNLQAGEVVVPATAFPGRQGRLAFAYLATHRRPVTRDELAEAIWGDAAPDGWPAHLAAIVSKLRALLAPIGLGDSLVAALGIYELCLPADVEVDLEAAANNLEVATSCACTSLRAYERCRQLLASELGVDPSAETTAAYHQLLHADE